MDATRRRRWTQEGALWKPDASISKAFNKLYSGLQTLYFQRLLLLQNVLKIRPVCGPAFLQHAQQTKTQTSRNLCACVRRLLVAKATSTTKASRKQTTPTFSFYGFPCYALLTLRWQSHYSLLRLCLPKMITAKAQPATAHTTWEACLLFLFASVRRWAFLYLSVIRPRVCFAFWFCHLPWNIRRFTQPALSYSLPPLLGTKTLGLCTPTNFERHSRILFWRFILVCADVSGLRQASTMQLQRLRRSGRRNNHCPKDASQDMAEAINFQQGLVIIIIIIIIISIYKGGRRQRRFTGTGTAPGPHRFRLLPATDLFQLAKPSFQITTTGVLIEKNELWRKLGTGAFKDKTNGLVLRLNKTQLQDRSANFIVHMPNGEMQRQSLRQQLACGFERKDPAAQQTQTDTGNRCVFQKVAGNHHAAHWKARVAQS